MGKSFFLLSKSIKRDLNGWGSQAKTMASSLACDKRWTPISCHTGVIASKMLSKPFICTTTVGLLLNGFALICDFVLSAPHYVCEPISYGWRSFLCASTITRYYVRCALYKPFICTKKMTTHLWVSHFFIVE